MAWTGDNDIWLKLVVMGYALAILGYSFYVFRRVRTYDDYNMGGRRMPLLPIVMTVAGTAVGGATLLGFMAKGFTDGLGQLWLVISLALSVLVKNLFFLKPLRRQGEIHNLYTVGDYAAVRYGPAARYPAMLGNLAALGALTGLQFLAIATVLDILFGIDRTYGVLIAFAFLTLKSWLGGLASVIRTDAIQGAIQTLGIVFLGVAVYAASGGWGAVHERAMSNAKLGMLDLFDTTAGQILLPLLTIGLSALVRQDPWQRIFAARDLKTTVRAYWISIVVLMITGGSVVAIGVMANLGLGLEPDAPSLVYYAVIDQVLPPTLVIVMIIVLIATILSCGDSFLIAGSTTLVADLVSPRVHEPSEVFMLRASRWAVVAMGVLSLALALAVPRLVDLWITGSAILASGVAVPLLCGLFWQRPGNEAGLSAMWAGLITAIVWQLAGHPFGLHPVFVGLPLSAIVFIVMTVRFTPKAAVS